LQEMHCGSKKHLWLLSLFFALTAHRPAEETA